MDKSHFEVSEPFNNRFCQDVIWRNPTLWLEGREIRRMPNTLHYCC